MGFFEQLILRSLKFGDEYGATIILGKNIIQVSDGDDEAVFQCRKSLNSEYINELDLIVWEKQRYYCNIINYVDLFLICSIQFQVSKATRRASQQIVNERIFKCSPKISCCLYL